MTATSTSAQRHPIEQLADDFITRLRQGERPSITEYVKQFPDISNELADIIGALLALEDLGDFGQQVESFPPVPERLGEYRIVREIGRGGMGVVYAAEQEELGRHVALKVLPSVALLRPTHLERFRREARAAARLHHTNIIPIYGVGAQDGIHYYAMQYIPGRGLDSLLDELKQQKNSSAAETAKTAITLLSGSAPTGTTEHYRGIARVGLQVAEALAHAHEHGVLHRDVKPGNVLLDMNGIAWLGDFGLAYLEGDAPLTSTGGFVGTLRYLAPERFKEEGDARSDIYSLGATLYELLTLRPMFEETDRTRLLRQVAQEDPPAPRKIDRSIPKDLETIVLKAIAKEPADRYAKCADLAEDLSRFLADRPLATRRISIWERFRRWVRRNPVIFGLLSAVVCSLAIGLGATCWQWRRAVNALGETERFAKEATEKSTIAQAHGHRAHQMLEGLLHELNNTLDQQPVAELRRKLMEKAFSVHEDLINETPVDPAERLDIAKLAYEVGDMWRRRKQLAHAEKYLLRAIALVEPEASESTGNLEYRYVKARAFGDLGINYREQTFRDKARDAFENSIQFYRALLAEEPTNRLYARGLGGALHNRGVLASDLGQDDQAIQDIREGIAISEPFLVSDPRASGLRLSIAHNYQTLTNQYLKTRQFSQARESSTKAMKLAEELESQNPRNPIIQDLVARCADKRGRVLVNQALAIQQNDIDAARILSRESESHIRRAQSTWQRLIEINRVDPDYRNGMADTMCLSGLSLILLNQLNDAEQIVKKSIQERSEALRLSPKHWIYEHGQAGNYFTLGRVYCLKGEHAKAANLAQQMEPFKLGHGAEFVIVAQLFCQCSISARTDATLSTEEQSRLAEQYLSQALDKLNQAIESAFNDRKQLETSPWLRPLYDRPEFHRILDKVPPKNKPAETPVID